MISGDIESPIQSQQEQNSLQPYTDQYSALLKEHSAKQSCAAGFHLVLSSI
jgi:hypothetical protein